MPQPRQRPRPKEPEPTPGPFESLALMLEAIHYGQLDDHIAEIQLVIDQRNEERKKKVEALVKEVYGEEYEVVKPTGNSGPTFRSAEDAVQDGLTETHWGDGTPPAAIDSPVREEDMEIEIRGGVIN